MTILKASLVVAVFMCGIISGPVAADEAGDQSCISTAASKTPSGSGPAIKAYRVKNPPKMIGYAEDNATRMVEFDVHTDAFDATYVYTCRSAPLAGYVAQLVAIDRQRHQ
jgi:hypothetical protein